MIYFIRRKSGGYIKIGTTTNMKRRANGLYAMCAGKFDILGVMPGNRFDENDIHWKFRRLRKHGEWFEAGEELVEFIKTETCAWDGTTNDVQYPRVDEGIERQIYRFGRQYGPVDRAKLVETVNKFVWGEIERIEKEKRKPSCPCCGSKLTEAIEFLGKVDFGSGI